MALTQEQVKKIYVGYLGRGADNLTPEALNLFESEAQFASFIFNSDEAKSKPGYPSILTIETVSAYINQIYQNLFGRAADNAAAGAQLVLSGVIAVDQAALFIANQAVPGSSDYDNLQKAIAQNKPVDPIGETFMLTAGVDVASTNVAYHGNMQNPDTFRFTDANETIEATTLTFGSGDTFTDGNDKDKDVLHITLQNYDVSKTIGTAANAVGSGAKISGIEVLDIDATAGGANTITYSGGFASITDLIIRGAFDGTAGGSGLSVTVGTADSALKTVDLTGVSYAGGDGLVFTASTNPNDLTITGPSFNNAAITGGNGNDTITGQGSINGGSGNDIITGKGSINGGNGNDTITATGLSTVDGGPGNDTISGYGSIKGGSGDDIITLTGASTVEGGSGIDTITTSTEGVVTFKYSSAGETAQGSGVAVADGAAFKAVAGASLTADTLTVKVGDKIDLGNISGYIVKAAILQNGGAAYKSTDTLSVTSGTGDVFLLENGDTYLLAYEIATGNSTDFGGATDNTGFEVIKLVGLTAANKITLDGNGIVTIV